MYIGITYELNDSKRVGEALVNIKKVANKNLTPEQYDEYKKEARILLAKRLSTEISNIIPIHYYYLGENVTIINE